MSNIRMQRMRSTRIITQLIEEVEKHPALYVLSHPKFDDNKHKLQLWKKIATVLNRDDLKCKSTWHSLRRNYRKAINRNRPYKYSKQLGFMDKWFYDLDVNNQERYGRKKHQQEIDEYEEYNIHNDDSFDIIEDTSLDSSEIKSVIKSHPVKSTNDTLNTNTIPTVHPLDAFLVGISATLKTLTPDLLHSAKSDIFAIAQKYELEMLRKQSDQTVGLDVQKEPVIDVPEVTIV